MNFSIGLLRLVGVLHADVDQTKLGVSIPLGMRLSEKR